MNHNPDRRIHQSGEIINEQYEIIRLLNDSSYGLTYLAEFKDGSDKTLCVIKQLQPKIKSFFPEAKKRFPIEADVLSRLGAHEQIPKLLDYFESNQEFYLVQEFIEGKDLNKLTKDKCWDEVQVINMLLDVLKILTFVHSQDVIHRDIKPSNLIQHGKDSKIFLIDFGVVKEIGDIEDADRLTNPVRAVGTPDYMPPEQEEGKPERGSDIYALGMTAIEVLTGKISKQTGQTDEFDRKICPKLGAVLSKMVYPELKKRYRSAQEVLCDLIPITMLGRTLNKRYKITKLIRSNKYFLSFTYLAQDQRNRNSSCIIKQFRPYVIIPQVLEEARKCFNIQLEKLNNLGLAEPIATVIEGFEEGESFYLVYEFIDGKNLSEEITEQTTISEDRVKEILDEVLQILDFIHSQKVIHFDIEPSNLVKRAQDNKIFLVDFGGVKEIPNLSFNKEGNVILKDRLDANGYSSPERNQGLKHSNTDIYALGMTAIQALTGVSVEQLNDRFAAQFFQEQRIRVSRKLKAILYKMVNPDHIRGNRYQTAAEVIRDLQNLQSSSNFQARSIFRFLPRIQVPQRQVSCRTLAILLSIPILLGLVSAWFFIELVLLETANAELYKQAKLLSDEAVALEKTDKSTADKKNKEALVLLNQALDKNYKFYEAWSLKGFVLGKLNRPEQNLLSDKLFACNNAIQFSNNEFAEGFNCRGSTYLELAKSIRNPEESKQYCQKALADFSEAINLLNAPFNQAQRDKLLPQYYYNKADVLKRLDRKQEAIEAANVALESKPDSNLEKQIRAMLYSLQGSSENQPASSTSKDQN